jgi:hypothetical protein
MQTDLDRAGQTEGSLDLPRKTLFQPVFLSAKGLFLPFPADVFNAKFQGFSWAPPIMVKLKYIMKCFFVKKKYIFFLALFS